MSTPWMILNARDLDAHGQAEGPSNRMFPFPSPYNLPIAIRVELDEAGKTFVEFRYIDEDEPQVTRDDHLGSNIWFGKNSHRIFRVYLDKETVERNKDRLTDTFVSVINGLRLEDRPRFQDNVAATARAVYLTGVGKRPPAINP